MLAAFDAANAPKKHPCAKTHYICGKNSNLFRTDEEQFIFHSFSRRGICTSVVSCIKTLTSYCSRTPVKHMHAAYKQQRATSIVFVHHLNHMASHQKFTPKLGRFVLYCPVDGVWWEIMVAAVNAVMKL